MNAELQAQVNAHALATQQPATTESSALRKAPTSLLVRALYQRRRSRPRHRSWPRHLQPAPRNLAAPSAELQPGEAASQGHRGAPAPVAPKPLASTMDAAWRVDEAISETPQMGFISRTSYGGPEVRAAGKLGSFPCGPHACHHAQHCPGVRMFRSVDVWLTFFYTSCYVS